MPSVGYREFGGFGNCFFDVLNVLSMFSAWKFGLEPRCGFVFLKVYIVSPTCCFINGDREVLFRPGSW